ncbi:MAG: hypothetical protein APF76_00380 [Desulfitibacter sp. BRH_c19]|nr:MAG: hypothetical protein APF76_00380 [Desulfitibacter sp. BRH_c19]
MKKKGAFFMIILLTILLIISGCGGNNVDVLIPEEPELSSLELAEMISGESKTSTHQYAKVETTDRGIGCAKCHDGVEFADKAEYTDLEFQPPHQTGISCQACHTGFGKTTMESGLAQ